MIRSNSPSLTIGSTVAVVPPNTRPPDPPPDLDYKHVIHHQ